MYPDRMSVTITWHSDQKYVGTAICLQLNPIVIASYNCVPAHIHCRDDVWSKDAMGRWQGRSGNRPNVPFIEALEAAEQHFIETIEKLDGILLTDSTDSTSS